MLSAEEVTALSQLIEGHRAPEDGMERHFLRVITGDAMPCSPKEQEWYQHWRQASSTPLDDYRSKYEQAANLLRKREETIRVQEENIVELELELKRLGGTLQQREQTIETHTKEISRLESWLKSAHEALNRYEPIRKTQDSPSLTNDDDKWSTCHACGRSIDYCRCSG